MTTTDFILEDYKEGKSLKEIAFTYNLSIHQIIILLWPKIGKS